MDPLLKKLRAENRLLCEAKGGQLREVRETLVVPVECLTLKDRRTFTRENAQTKVIEEVTESIYHLAKVGSYDRKNGNERIYPAKEWARNIERAERELIPNGRLMGAFDHVGSCYGGNFKDNAILWHKLAMDTTGGVMGEFSLFDTRRGRDLQAIIDGGGAVGFSTYGYASAHKPTDEEREFYGLAPLSDDGTGEDDEVVIVDDWTLIKIDAVDNPSVRDAWMKRKTKTGESRHRACVYLTEPGEGRAAPTPEANGAQPKADDMELKTLDDLQKHYPAVFDLHTQAIATAVKAEADKLAPRIAELEKIQAKYQDIVNKLSESLTCLADQHGATRPFREVTAAEMQQKLDALEAAKAQVEQELAATKAEKAALAAKVAEAEAAKADQARREAVTAKLAECLKDEKGEPIAFADQIRAHIESRLAEASLTADTVAGVVKAKGEEYAQIALAVQPKSGPKDEGLKGKDVQDSDFGDDAEELEGEEGGKESFAHVPESIKKLRAELEAAKAKKE